MKTPKPFLLLPFLFFACSLSAQVQWYQNQDGSNGSYNPTMATQVLPLSNSSFAACYYWSTNNDQITWKISKTNGSGTEVKTLMLTGTNAQVDIRAGHQKSMYVLMRDFPVGVNPVYTVYKLDTSLVIRKQYRLNLPADFSVLNLNVFEVDYFDNIYLAGSGQYPDGPGYQPASFVVKTNKNLEWRWNRYDSTQTAYTGLHVNAFGIITLVADFYSFFPDVHVSRISGDGRLIGTKTITTDPGRTSLASVQDDDGYVYLYGGRIDGNGSAGMYLYKISSITGNTAYRKNYFTGSDIQVNDLKYDHEGNFFSLVTLYNDLGQQSRVSRIRTSSGRLEWNRVYLFNRDSCNLSRLVLGGNDRFYAVGEQRNVLSFARAFALRLRTSGQGDGDFPAPDSVGYYRNHSLCDGVIDRQNRLIAIGNTYDLDAFTYQSTYYRSFAVKYGDRNNGNCGRGEITNDAGETSEAVPGEETDEALTEKSAGNELPVSPALVFYPNPATDLVTVSNLDPDIYDHLTIYNMQGASLLKQSVNGSSVKVDVRQLPAGVYLLTLNSSQKAKSSTMKFVVKR